LSIEWVLELVLFSVLHWILTGTILNDIANRKRILGGHKAPWVIVVILLTFVGSYFIFFATHKSSVVMTKTDRD